VGVDSQLGASVAAIEQMYRSRYARFLRLAVALSGDVDRGRDAVQEAFARALRSRRDFRGGSLDGWLWRTLVNVCLQEKRHLAEPLLAPPEAETNGASTDWPELRALIALLPERQRLVLFLRYYADLNHDQIGEALGIERGTVAASLHSAHNKIRQAIQEVPR
jgi:RNA polymerase sigma factor (sigma-70 family)